MADPRRILAIRPGERGLIARIAAVFAVVEAGRGVGEIGADTLLLGSLGPTALPYLYVGLGLVSLVAALTFGVAVGRTRRRPFLVAVLTGLAVLLALERIALTAGGSSVLPVVWLSVYVTGAIAATLVWVLAGWLLDARQAKRLFPLCASAAILGGFVGMLAAGPLAAIAGTADLVLVEALLLAVGAVLVADVGRRGPPLGRRTTRRSVAQELRTSFDDVRRSPLLARVAVAYVLFAVLAFAVSYPFLTAMSEAFPSDVELATALGLLSAGVTAASFLVAVVVANRLSARLGIATVALVLPIVYLVGFGAWLVRFDLATAVGFRFAQQVTQRGLSNAIWSAFYNVVPGERRAQVLSFMDGVPNQLGTALAGLLLLAVSGLPSLEPVFLLGVAAAILCVTVVLGIRRRYADSVLRTLRSGRGEQLLEGGPGLVVFAADRTVLANLQVGLVDDSPGVRRLSADLLGRLRATEARADLERTLHDAAPEVRAAAVDALTGLGVPLSEDEASRLGSDPDPAVRAEVAIALIRAGGEDPSHAMLAALIEGATPDERIAGLEAVARLRGHAPSPAITTALADPVPDVRAAAIRALAAVEPPLGDPVPVLLQALDDEAGSVRLAAARALGDRGEEVCPPLLDVLRTGSDRAREAALVALEGHGGSVHDEVADWVLEEAERAAGIRRRRLGLAARPAGAAPPDASATTRDDVAAACVDYLTFVLSDRERRIEERLVHALAVLGAPDAGGVIRRSLAADDAETRALATELLDSVGDRRVGRAVVALLEGDDRAELPDAGEVLRELTTDADEWTRTLAARALASGDGSMPGSAETMSGIDRMLVLRRVALFTELAPEDLQRIAAGAVERVYEPDEALVREGEPGDELIVIVEGTVRVVQAGAEGEGERLIRTFGAGDHIGELAVLRAHPRVATVIADGLVRGLAIDGTGLKAILRERPEAAMAMLATLADRIAAR